MSTDTIYRFMFPVLAYIGCAVLAIIRITGRCKIQKKLQTCLLILPRNQSRLFILVLLCAPILIGTLFFRNFGFFVNAILAVSGILIVEISLRDIILRSISGIYNEGISVDGKLLYRTDIETVIPRPDSYEGTEDSILRLSTKAGIITIRFDTEEDRTQAVQIISEWADSVI